MIRFLYCLSLSLFRIFTSTTSVTPLFFERFRKLRHCIEYFSFQVYHTFLDEVNFYKTHIWRCNGICQHRKPFFGYVRRTANRAPGVNDQWWAQHHEQCGGNFLKVSEPDPVVKKRKGKTNASNGTSATKKPNATNSKIDNPRWGMVKKTTPTATAAASKTSTIVVRKPVTKKSDPPTGQLTADQSAGRSLSNVVGLKDLNGKFQIIYHPIMIMEIIFCVRNRNETIVNRSYTFTFTSKWSCIRNIWFINS